MYSRSLLSLLLLGLTGLSGCVFAFSDPNVEGSGTIVTRDRPMPDVDEISVCCGFRVDLEEGDEPSLAITGDDNIVSDIQTRRRGGVVYVEYEDNSKNYQPTQPIRVHATLTDVRAYSGSGGSQLEASTLETDELTVSLSGGSRATFSEVRADSFDLSSSGGSVVDVAGEVNKETVEIGGGGIYDAGGFDANRVELDLHSGAQATVRAMSRLEVSASGGSSATYFGDPEVQANTSGGSSVEPE